MRQLTDKQREVLAAIDALTIERGYSPSLTEIGERYGSPWTHAMRQFCQALTRKGFLERPPFRIRAMRIVKRDDGDAVLVAGKWVPTDDDKTEDAINDELATA